MTARHRRCRKCTVLAGTALVVPLLLLAGCGGSADPSSDRSNTPDASSSSPGTSSSTPADADGGPGSAASDRYPGAEGSCTVLSPRQVAAVLGSEAEASGSGHDCSAQDDGDHEIDVMVYDLDGTAYSYRDEADFVKQHDALTTTQKPVSDVGDAAYFSVADSTLSLVCHGQFVSIQVKLSATSDDLDPTTDKSKEKGDAVTLARTAVARCPVDLG